MKKSGRLIVIEGLDGSGKATQTELLIESLKRSGIDPLKVTFPDYGEPSSSLVKMYLNGEFGVRPGDVNAYAASSFYAVDRYASYKKHWGGYYDRGGVVVCDRYVTSNVIYQMAKLPQAEWDGFIAWVEDFEYSKLGLPRPDLVLYLDMPVNFSQKLIEKRYAGDSGKKDLHERDAAFLRDCSLAAAYACGRLGFEVIKTVAAGGKEPRPPHEISAQITGRVERIIFND
jgi:dTMP kinase